MNPKATIKPEDHAPPGSTWERVFNARTQMRASVAAGLLLVGWLIARHAAGWEHADVFAWTSLAIGMVYGLRAAWESLRERVVDIDVLMVVGAGAAAAIGHAEEGATLLFLFVLAGALEELAMERTRREIEALHALMPTEAVVFREGAWTTRDLSDLRTGDRIRLRPGDRAPTDARVSVGTTAFDQSAITGESMPREVVPGDDIYAGTINVDDPIEAVVSRPAVESSLSRILDLVTKAREQREPVQRTIDRLSQPYATGVMAASAVLFVLWWTWLGRPWQDSLYTAITFLIVASPCALVIATPTATLAAIARAARGGVLFKGGQSIERLANVGAVCFDKTGTLTLGRPKLTQVHPVAWSSGEELLSIAAGLERDSTHPIATAVREAAQARGIAPAEVHDFDHTTGRGMTGTVNGHRVSLGSYTHAERIIPVCLRGRVQEVLERIQGRGDLGVVVAQSRDVEAGDGQAAVLIMSDIVRPGAAEMVRMLHDLGIRPLRMLTGDNRLTAQRVASRLGLDRFDAELLPEDKVAAVQDTKTAMEGTGRRGRRLGVAVIGDGVNDAPALAASDIAIGIGSIGSDAALESADVVLLSDDLAAVPWAIELARRTRRKIRFNLSLALSVIFIMALMTVIGSIVGRPVTLTLGVLAHEGGTLLVVLNSLLLLWIKPYAPSAVARIADDRRHADAIVQETPAGANAANG